MSIDFARRVRGTLLMLALSSAAGCRHANPPTSAPDVPVQAAVPVGVTLVPLGEKSRIAGKNGAGQAGEDAKPPGAVYAVRLGTGDGSPLYYTDKPADCDAHCLKKFPAFLASAGASAGTGTDATAGGAWTLLATAGGGRQWAYRGHALHTRVAAADDDAALPAAWHLARFEPAEGVQPPPGIEVRESRTAGAVLTDARGMTVYELKTSLPDFAHHCDLRCQQPWQPLYAPALAAAAEGDFSILERPDGTRQWARRTHALFTFQGDSLPGETSGMETAAAAGQWQIAALLAYPTPAAVVYRDDPVQGPIWATRDGAPLYTRHRYDANDFGGKNFRGTFHQPYGVGKDIGVSGCDAPCQQEWPPLLATAADEPWGYWQILVRDDGRRQWAYKGYALYTYSRDTPGGAVTGTNIYTLDRGDAGRYKVSELTTLADRTLFREGAYFWHVAIPDL